MGRAARYTDAELLDALRRCGGNEARACDLLGCAKGTIHYAIETREGFLGKVARIRVELAAQGKLDLGAESKRKGNVTRLKKLRKANPKGECKPVAGPLSEVAQVCLRTHGHTESSCGGLAFPLTPFVALGDVSELIERVTCDNWREVYAAVIVKLAAALRRFPVDDKVTDIDDGEDDE